MFKPSTAPRWKIAIKVLRRPPVRRSRAWASTARCRNDGAVCISPKLASAIPPDLIKNLRFITKNLVLCTLCSVLCRAVSALSHDLRTQRTKFISSKYKVQTLLSLKFRRTQYQPHDLCDRIRDVGISTR